MWKECDKFTGNEEYRLTFKNSYDGWGHIVYDELSCSYEATKNNSGPIIARCKARPPDGAATVSSHQAHPPGDGRTHGDRLF